MASPKHIISKPTDIFNQEYIARIYSDKIIISCPTIRWIGNSGSYHEARKSIRDQKIIDSVRAEMADDCEDSAWAAIGRALQDPYLAGAY